MILDSGLLFWATLYIDTENEVECWHRRKSRSGV